MFSPAALFFMLLFCLLKSFSDYMFIMHVQDAFPVHKWRRSGSVYRMCSALCFTNGARFFLFVPVPVLCEKAPCTRAQLVHWAGPAQQGGFCGATRRISYYSGQGRQPRPEDTMKLTRYNSQQMQTLSARSSQCPRKPQRKHAIVAVYTYVKHTGK